ncbi:hypothetical protein EPI10_022759 [Gossypium australe]|uniref:Uncharacterized protein n=1 Tax=Gossypium australe TaxID=47621 RepID=A0A5B6VTF5_9ROSI|nr:hypothetical protein EPI10_022759 [Gossypium australe]
MFHHFGLSVVRLHAPKRSRRERIVSVSEKIDIGCVREGRRGWSKEPSSSLGRFWSQQLREIKKQTRDFTRRD